MNSFDVIVLGVGGMGSAACHHLARSGARVLGIDQFPFGHAWGSSHGKVRLVRRAYFEHPDYVPLLTESYRLWEELEVESGRKLFHKVGLVIVGPPTGGVALPGCELSADRHGVRIEKLDGSEVRRRYPVLRPPEGYRAVLEPEAGYVELEPSIEAHARCAEAKGARFVFRERVVRWMAHPSSVTVKTDRGSYGAAKLVITAGPWTGQVFGELGLPLTVRRAPQFWMKGEPGYRRDAGMPCFAFDMPYSFLYGFPSLGDDLVKMGDHTPREVVDNASSVDRNLHPDDGENVRRCIAEGLSGLETQPAEASVCLYTMTPDEHFVIDQHPKHPHVFFAGGFSGHGYKFTPVVGKVLSELALRGETSSPIGFLRLAGRFPTT